MNDEPQQRVVTVLAAGMTFRPEPPGDPATHKGTRAQGVKDDVLEAVLKGGTTAISTVLPR